jgi:hypothetical protein
VVLFTQDNRPIAFFSRKLFLAQRKYSVTKIKLLAVVETLQEFKGILWGQPINVYTHHKNLIRDALGLTSDCVYRWRLLLEEYGPEIVNIKGTHNTVADSTSRLEYDPSINQTANSKSVQKQNWMTVSKHWCNLDMDDTAEHEDHMNLIIANHGEEEDIYPLTTIEIAKAQQKDLQLKIYHKKDVTTSNKVCSFKIIDDTQVLCKNDKLIIPTSLQHRAVSWNHHYLQHQHPGR